MKLTISTPVFTRSTPFRYSAAATSSPAAYLAHSSASPSGRWALLESDSRLPYRRRGIDIRNMFSFKNGDERRRACGADWRTGGCRRPPPFSLPSASRISSQTARASPTTKSRPPLLPAKRQPTCRTLRTSSTTSRTRTTCQTRLTKRCLALY